MPKLRYKHSEPKPKKHKKSKKEKTQYYSPPKLYEPEPGRSDDIEWRQRLFEAMREDEDQDPFYSQYQEQPTMTDEEYRASIVKGIYQRRHRDEIESEKRRHEQKQAKRKLEAAERAEAEAEAERLRRIYRDLKKTERAERDQERYREGWKRLESGKDILWCREIPWPVVTGKVFSLEGVRDFLIDSEGSALENKKKVRKEQTRYHPDKFVTRYMGQFKGSSQEREKVLSRINEISGWLNELWAQVNV